VAFLHRHAKAQRFKRIRPGNCFVFRVAPTNRAFLNIWLALVEERLAHSNQHCGTTLFNPVGHRAVHQTGAVWRICEAPGWRCTQGAGSRNGKGRVNESQRKSPKEIRVFLKQVRAFIRELKAEQQLAKLEARLKKRGWPPLSEK